MANIMLSNGCRMIVDEIAKVAGNLWQREWAERNGGNITVEVTDLLPDSKSKEYPEIPFAVAQPELAGRSFFVKVGGARMGDVARQPEPNLLLITINKNLKGYRVIWGGSDAGCRPTSEFISHLKIHQYLRQNKMKQKVFLHTHPTHLIALSHIKEYCNSTALNELLFAMHPEVKINIPEGVGFAPYRCPASEDLADVTVAAMQQYRVIVWEKHGCAAIAENATESFDLIDIANKAAQIFFICKNAGFTPEGLSAGQISEIDSTFNLK